jgi:hypothetical protein
MKVTAVGVDIAKYVFQLHGVSATGEVLFGGVCVAWSCAVQSEIWATPDQDSLYILVSGSLRDRDGRRRVLTDARDRDGYPDEITHLQSGYYQDRSKQNGKQTVVINDAGSKCDRRSNNSGWYKDQNLESQAEYGADE